jgi:hypothetical protein
MHYHVIARAVVWSGRLQVFGTEVVRDCCSHRPANDMMSPPVPGAYFLACFGLCTRPSPVPLPHPRHRLLIQFAPMLGCFTSWYRVWPPSHFVSYLSLPRWLVSSSWFPSQIAKLGGSTDRSPSRSRSSYATLRSVPVYTPFSKLSL